MKTTIKGSSSVYKEAKSARVKWPCSLGFYASALCTLAVTPHVGLAGTFNTTVVIKPYSSTTPVNTLVTGTSIHWTANGDNIYDPSTGNFLAAAVSNTLSQKPATLRYPGGSLSDTYHWTNGIGTTRQTNVVAYDGSQQTVNFGTQEFLELCEALGTEPVITVNVMTGTATEAADWVHYVNVTGLTSRKTGQPLPKVKRWEIGNEPYLPNTGAGAAMTTAAYAQKATDFIAAMKGVDSTIQTGVALRGDPLYMFYTSTGYEKRNRETDPVPPNVAGNYTPWNRPVLSALQASGANFDFVSIHAGYGPFWFERGAGSTIQYPSDPAESYRQAMAQSAMTREQLDAVNADLASVGLSKPIFNSEFGPIFRNANPAQPENAYGASFTGALEIADHLALFASRSDVGLASRWSLMGNAYWGALTTTGTPRPAHAVLVEFTRIQKGYNLTVDLPSVPTFSTSFFGRNWPQSNLPLITAYGGLDRTANTSAPAVARVMLVNRSPDDTANITLYGLGGSGSRKSLGTSVTTKLLSNAPADSYLSLALPQATTSTVATTGCAGPDFSSCQVTYQLPPHSVVFVDINLLNSN